MLQQQQALGLQLMSMGALGATNAAVSPGRACCKRLASAVESI
jgi:hypothetical protein